MPGARAERAGRTRSAFGVRHQAFPGRLRCEVAKRLDRQAWLGQFPGRFLVHAYPENLAMFLRQHWAEPAAVERFWAIPCPGESDPLPASPLLEQLLSTCYQASLMRDEGRPVRFRMMLREPAGCAFAVEAPRPLDRLVFAEPVPFTANELRRLAPAVAFERSIIGVRMNRQQPEIWGIMHSGTDWLQAMEGLRRDFQPLPPCLVISVLGPGHVGVGRGSVTVAGLLAGRVTTPAPGVFDWVDPAELRDEAQEELLALHERDRENAGRPWAKLDPEFVSLLRRRLALRLISALRQAQHGGTVLVLPQHMVRRQATLSRYIRVKYLFVRREPQGRYYTLFVRLLNSLAEACAREHGPERVVGWREYLGSNDPAVVEADEALNELSHLIANLAAVDGAVLMSRPVEMVGFGGEISGRLPHVDYVARALDQSAERVELESTSGVGTRHRSVYRLCNVLPEAMAVVVSQDGGVRMVRKRGDHVTYWEQMSSGMFGL